MKRINLMVFDTAWTGYIERSTAVGTVRAEIMWAVWLICIKWWQDIGALHVVRVVLEVRVVHLVPLSADTSKLLWIREFTLKITGVNKIKYGKSGGHVARIEGIKSAIKW